MDLKEDQSTGRAIVQYLSAHLCQLEDGQLFGLYLLSLLVPPDETDSEPERNGPRVGA